MGNDHFCDTTKRASQRPTPHIKRGIPLYHRSRDKPLDPTTLTRDTPIKSRGFFIRGQHYLLFAAGRLPTVVAWQTLSPSRRGAKPAAAPAPASPPPPPRPRAPQWRPRPKRSRGEAPGRPGKWIHGTSTRQVGRPPFGFHVCTCFILNEHGQMCKLHDHIQYDPKSGKHNDQTDTSSHGM